MTKSFNHKEDLVSNGVNSIIMCMEKSLAKHNSVRVLLSGGSTPGPIYKLLNKHCEFIDSIHFGLVDERYVNTLSEFSNERLIRGCFTNEKVKKKTITGMVFDESDKYKNLQIVREKYIPFIERTDIVILGMGKDGHTASIFPDDEGSKTACESSEKTIFNTHAPDHPKDRITCGMDLICSAQTIILFISGMDKWQVLNDKTKKLPIHEVMERRSDINIFYSKA